MKINYIWVSLQFQRPKRLQKNQLRKIFKWGKIHWCMYFFIGLVHISENMMIEYCIYLCLIGTLIIQVLIYKIMEKEGWKEVEECNINSTKCNLCSCILNIYAVHSPVLGSMHSCRSDTFFLHTQALLDIARLYKSKRLCAIWMSPALKFEPCYQSWWIMINNAESDSRGLFLPWVITAAQETIHSSGVAAAKCMFWFSALGVSSLQLIFLFQLLL